MQIIETQGDIERGVAALIKQDEGMAQAVATLGPIPLRRRDDGFRTLAQAIVGQQISVAAAQAIWGKMEAANLAAEDTIFAASFDDLRGAGLSRQKIKYLQSLAAAQIDYTALRTMPDADVMQVLTAVSGIGAWSAEIYLMFALGRPDVFAHGDLALQEGARHLYSMQQRPTAKEMQKIAEKWAPWRGVAARVLWAYYAYIKQREGVV